MNQQDHLFENSKQLSQKLAVALTRFFLDGPLDPSLEERYRQFLRRRPFTALQWILHQGTPALLERYLAAGWISRQDLERGLAQDDLSLQMRALLLQALDDGQPPQASPPEPDALSLLELTQLKLFERLPRLRMAISRFSFSPTEKGSGTDGAVIYYSQPQIRSLFREGRLEAFYLHMVVHCLWLHFAGPFKKNGQNFPDGLWDLACDICAFHLSEQFSPPSPDDPDHQKDPRRQVLRALPDSLDLSSAPALAEFLSCSESLSPAEWFALFTVDDHSWWRRSPHTGDVQSWSRLRREMGSIPSPSRQRFGLNPGSRLERLELRREAKFDFSRYLRRFTVTEEELQLDLDSFDYIPYLYGLARYGNLPLVEPLEYTETSKVEELVIAIDTSGSCSAGTVQQFLAETCRILANRENFFRRMNVHILQCDSMIQDHTVIHSVEEWERYIRQLRISGRGGTDFTPVFSYTDRMIQEKQFRCLKGLIYFTDGDGVYPRRQPSYETAFVFADRRFLSQPVPDWAVKLCLNLK